MTLSIYIQYTHQYHAAFLTHGDVHHGLRSLAGDVQIFVAVYGVLVCQEAAQPSIEPYSTCKQAFKWLLDKACSLQQPRHRWLCNVCCPITLELSLLSCKIGTKDMVFGAASVSAYRNCNRLSSPCIWA